MYLRHLRGPGGSLTDQQRARAIEGFGREIALRGVRPESTDLVLMAAHCIAWADQLASRDETKVSR